RKRDGHALTSEEIASFVDGVTDGAWADYQMSALLMAMFLNGLNKRETNALTRAMLESGQVMDLSDIEAPKADKHSTGGVGDKTSLLIAPLAAACGLAVPMVSGRALGHTGGTLDKLESIPGFNVRLPFADFKRVLKQCGLALAGQTAQIAPADRKLYSLRDATATVPYIPLIVASIMSKKLAEGLDALVLDVKTGSGAFIANYRETLKLAHELTATGRAFKVKTRALITDMSQPLGKYVGNAVEVYECIKIMRGEGEPAMRPTTALSVELTAQMLVLAKIDNSLDAARSRCERALGSGDALERFRQNIILQGGDPRVCDKPEALLDKSLKKIPVTADRSGYITAIDTHCVGQCIGNIGGGRVKAEDKVDHAVGYSSDVKLGTRVRKGDELGIILARTKAEADSISQQLQNAYTIGPKKPDTTSLIRTAV
ncbi:MAG: thymidine phosphorylase, partial [Acidobacteria bacterium]|nr:thymidine phosphorylase [Acidobacteriota bacterium]